MLLSCSAQEESKRPINQIPKKNLADDLQHLQSLASKYALEEGYVLSWEKSNQASTRVSKNHISIKISCDYTQTYKTFLECYTLSTLDQLPSQGLQKTLCLKLSSKKHKPLINKTLCESIYSVPPTFNNQYINQKAELFLSNNNPMQLASFKWSSSEWLYFLAYLNNKLSKKQISILDNYFRFSDTKDQIIQKAFENLIPID